MAVRFYLNKRKGSGNAPVSVALVALRGEEQVKVMTPVKVKPSAWAPKEQRVRSSVPGSAEINGSLARLKADAESMLLDYPDYGELREALRARLGKATPSDAAGVLALFEQFMEGKKARWKGSTVQVYEGLQQHLEGFVGAAAGPETIGPGWLDDFVAHLVGKGIQNATTNKLLSRTKTFLRWMVERGALQALPTAKPLPTANNFATYLSKDELRRLASVDLSGTVPRRGHEAARDLFVFSALTGQRFSDVHGMRWVDLHPKEAPEVWNLYVKKTNAVIPITLPAPARAMIQRRREEPRPLPALSNQKANEYIKEVARLAGIDGAVTVQRMKGGKREAETMPKHEALTMHVGQKTFVTLALQSGIPMNELLGYTHEDLKSLEVYAGQDRDRLTGALREAFDDLFALDISRP